MNKPRLTTGTATCACGNKKQYWALSCIKCTRAARKPPEDPHVYVIDGGRCRKIALTKGQYAIVDEADFAWLSVYSWHSIWSQQTQSFYAARGKKKEGEPTTVMLAREIMGSPEGKNIDHKNHDTLDDRRRNLREANEFQSSYNRRRSSRNKSGYKGVSWHAVMGRYVVTISAGGKQTRLGYVDDPAEGYKIYCAAAEKLHEEFARLR